MMEVNLEVKNMCELREVKHMWPATIEGKRGMYCERCGTVVYSRVYRLQPKWRCPVCESSDFFFIVEEEWQPKVQYGSVPYKVCVECGTIVYGTLNKCPECGGRLAQ